ncbi:DUF2339 domain-containing protein [Bacillus sp. 2205SS5-2]|uniref:DUF2339 domain-containing protein n=1 Tax=Bacillus sp. 2205SS5-2 TaxID=3109031 RepID=UPI0030044AAE
MNAEIQELRSRIEKLEAEVTDLRGQVGKVNTLTKIQSSKSPTPSTILNQNPRPITIDTHVSKEEVQKQWGEEIGQTWLPRIFIFVLLLGVVWGFAAAIEGGFVTESIRVASGYSFALVLYGIGIHQFRRKHFNLAFSLLGGTIVLLFLTTFSAHMLYEFISFWPAFLLNACWLVLGLITSYYFKTEIIAVIVSLGGFLVPFLLDGAGTGSWLFYTYETLLYAIFLLFSYRFQYRWLHYISFLFLPLTLVAYGVLVQPSGNEPAYIMLLQHLLISVVVFYKHHLTSKDQISSLFTSAVITSLFCFSLLDGWSFDTVLLSLIFAYSTLSIYLYFGKNLSEKIPLSVVLALYFIGLYTYHLSGDELLTSLLLLQAVLGIYLAVTLKSKLILLTSGMTFLLATLRVFMIGYWELWSPELITWLVFFASTISILWLENKHGSFFEKNLKSLTVIILSFMLLLFLGQFGNTITIEYSYMIQQMTISLLWLCYAVGYIIVGKWKNSSPLQTFGLVMIFVVLLKAIFVDLPISSLTIRAVLFIILGGIGLLVSRFYYSEKKK